MKKLQFTLSFIILCFLSYGQVEMGGATNFTEIEQDGTLEFHGDATVWNDYVVPMSSIKTKETKEPKWVSFMGTIYQYKYENKDQEKDEQEAGFVIQMPHDWDGSTIYPHIHWSPENDNQGNVVWGIVYTWVNYNNSTPLSFPDTVINTTVSVDLNGHGHKHLITEFDPIIPTASQNTISSLLVVRFYRNSSNAADDYGSGAFALSFDIHYRTNTAGSREQFTK